MTTSGALVTCAPLKFQDLEQSLPGTSPTMLSARLKTLEEKGVVSKHLYQEHPPRIEYSLTDKGKELRFAPNALRKLGEQHTGRLTAFGAKRPFVRKQRFVTARA